MALFELILPIFLVIFLGFFLKSAGVFDEAFVRVLNRLVYQVFLPVLVFWEISRAPFHTSFNPRLVLITYGAMGIIWLFVMGAGRFSTARRSQVGVLAQGSFRGNLAYIGLALAYNLYGSPGLSKAGVLTGFMIPFMNFFSILGLILSRPAGCVRPGWGALVHSVFLNPLILASFIGLWFSYGSWSLPAILANTFRLLSGISLPLALISLGGNLSFQGIKGGLTPAILGTALKLILLPAIGLLLLRYGRFNGLDVSLTVILLACPTAVVTYIMATELGGDADLATSLILLSTLVSMISIPLWVWSVGL
jgi:malate permease and related proteins